MSQSSTSFDNVNFAETYINVKVLDSLEGLNDNEFRHGKLAYVAETNTFYILDKLGIGNTTGSIPTKSGIGSWVVSSTSGEISVNSGDIVFRPNGPAEDGVYLKFLEAVAAAQAMPGSPRIMIDNTYANPISVLGNNDVVDFQRRIRLGAIQSSTYVEFINFQFQHLQHIEYPLLVSNGGANVLCDLDPSDVVFLDGAIVQGGVAPFFNITSGAFPPNAIIFGQGARFNSGATPVLNVVFAASVDLKIIGAAVIDIDTIGGPGGSFVRIQPGTTGLLLAGQGTFSGTTTIDYKTDPQFLNYDANPADWVAPPPVNQQEFNDRVAALLVALNGGSIP